MSIATPSLTRDQWLQERRSGIGASECAAILGLSPWKTPLQVYFEKTGEIPQQEPTARMKWGLKLERLIAEDYQEQTGAALLDKPPAILRLDSAPWCLASLDYWTADRVVEIKTVGQYSEGEFGEPGTDEIPKHYALQVQQQMACAGRDKADLVALFLGSYETHVYTIVRRDDLIAELVEAEREFMDRVCRRDPPLPDFKHPSTADILAMIEPEPDETVVFDESAASFVAAYELLGGKMGEEKKLREEMKSRIIHAMGKAEQGYLPDGRIVRRKKSHRKGYSVEATDYIDFRILKGSST